MICIATSYWYFCKLQVVMYLAVSRGDESGAPHTVVSAVGLVTVGGVGSRCTNAKMSNTELWITPIKKYRIYG